MSAQISQISEFDKDEEYEGIEVMELHPFTTNRADGAQRSFNPTNQENFNKVGRPRGYVNRQNSGNNAQSNGRGNFKSFHSKYQDEPKPAKWDAQFQVYDIEGKAVLEALKKLTAFTVLKENGSKTEYSRRLAQYNPNLKARFSLANISFFHIACCLPLMEGFLLASLSFEACTGLGNGCERFCASRSLLGSYVHQESI